MTTSQQQAVLYARFSPRPDARDCDSVERQLAQLREWCQPRRLPIRSEHFDKAASGGDRDRVGFYDALHACRRGDVLLVREWDRFARDRTFAGLAIEDLHRRGVEVRSIAEQGDMPDTLESRLVRGILLELAEYRRHLIAAKTRAAMLRYQAAGRKMSSRAPFGQRIDGQALVADDDELQVVQRILAARRGGASYRQIARQLTAEGVPSRGQAWHHSSIARVCRRFLTTTAALRVAGSK